MSARRAHGRTRPEVVRPDELPAGVPAPPPEHAGPAERDRAGRFRPGNRTSVRGAHGKAARDVKRWARSLGVGAIVDKLGADAHLRPHVDEADRWYRARTEEVASLVGGGVASAGVCSILRTAAMQRAFSAFLFELGMTGPFAWNRGKDGEQPTISPRLDLVQVASKLGDASRQNQLAAHELAAREGAARPKALTWYALPSAPTTTSASTRGESAPDSSQSEKPEGDDDEEDEPARSADVRSGEPGDEDGDEEQATRTSAPTRHVEAPRPAGPSWLPSVLAPFAFEFSDLAKLHPLARHAAVVPRAQALARLRRLGSEEHGAAIVQAVAAWRAANPLPPEEKNG